MRHHLLVALLLVVGCTADTFAGDDGGGGDSGNPNNDVVDPPDGGPPSEASTSDADASSVVDAPLDVFVPIHYRIFVTSQTYTANLGNLSGADAICTTTGAKLGGTGHWKAWLSSSQTDAKTRLFHSTLPYVRTDGVQIAADWVHFTMGIDLSAAITIDENGNNVNAGDAGTRWVMTSTDEYGAAFLDVGTCDDFTSGTDTNTTAAVGNSSSKTHRAWTISSGWACTMYASIYCVEQP